MATENCLQICYRGNIGCIFYFPYHRYGDIIQLAMDRFRIPAKHKSALLFSDEMGHIFDRLSFEYYLKLFPEPELIFYMRYDYNRSLNIFLSQTPSKQCINTDTDTADATTTATTTTLAAKKSGKRVRDASDNDGNAAKSSTCHAVPVRRMNCFIGELPVNFGAQMLDADQNRPITKRMRLIDSKKRSRKSLAQPKHILRI